MWIKISINKKLSCVIFVTILMKGDIIIWLIEYSVKIFNLIKNKIPTMSSQLEDSL